MVYSTSHTIIIFTFLVFSGKIVVRSSPVPRPKPLGPTKFPAIPAAREQTGGIEESGLQLWHLMAGKSYWKWRFSSLGISSMVDSIACLVAKMQCRGSFRFPVYISGDTCCSRTSVRIFQRRGPRCCLWPWRSSSIEWFGRTGFRTEHGMGIWQLTQKSTDIYRKFIANDRYNRASQELSWLILATLQEKNNLISCSTLYCLQRKNTSPTYIKGLGGNHCVYTQTVLGVQIFAEKTILGPQFIPFLPVKSIEPLKKGKKTLSHFILLVGW